MGPVGWISRVPRRGSTPLVACHRPDAVVVRAVRRCDLGERPELLGFAEPIRTTTATG
jgi:hypothetical protein